jgi:energy-coupling factor transporter ATP-binding protein EcfA2
VRNRTILALSLLLLTIAVIISFFNSDLLHLYDAGKVQMDGVRQLWFSGGRLSALQVTPQGQAKIYEWQLTDGKLSGAEKPIFAIDLDVHGENPGTLAPHFEGPWIVAATDNPAVIAWATENMLHVRGYKEVLEPSRDTRLTSQPRELFWGNDARIVIRYDDLVEIRDRNNLLLFSMSLGKYEGRYPIRRAGPVVGIVDPQRAILYQIRTDGTPDYHCGDTFKQLECRIVGLQGNTSAVFLAPNLAVNDSNLLAHVVVQQADKNLQGPPGAYSAYVKDTIRALVPLGREALIAGDFSGIARINGSKLTWLTNDAPKNIRLLAWDNDSSLVAFATDDTVGLYKLSSASLAQRILDESWITQGIFLLGIVLGAMAVLGYLPHLITLIRKRQAEKKRKKLAEQTVIPPVPQQLPDPVPPQELIESCALGECVLFAGSGISAAAGMPAWRDFVHELLGWALDHDIVDSSKHQEQLAAWENGEFNAVADNVANAFGNRIDLLQQFIHGTSGFKAPLPASVKIIPQIPFAAVLTTNFDDLLERAYESNVEVYTPHDPDALNKAADQRKFYLLHLHGSPKKPETIIFSPASYKAMVDSNHRFSRFIDSLFFSSSILFIGASLEGIEAFLSSFTIRSSIPRQHFALVAVTGIAWWAKAEALQRRYKITLIPFRATEGYPEVEAFLKALQRKTDERVPFTVDKSQKRSCLLSVYLKDIGPFHELDLQLAANMESDFPNWTVILGDNGVGKSTILKALAAVVAGTDAHEFAGFLVRSGKSSGFIRVVTDRTGNSGFEMRIDRDGDSVEIECQPGDFVKKERALILGFGPLRIVSRARPRGPQPQDKGLLSSIDVLPLLRGEPDPRMDKVKQWIVNLHSNAQSEELRGNQENQYRQLLKRFTEVLAALTPGLKLKAVSVKEDFQVWVELPDGEIPIESLSQGTTALFGWIGILLQRMYEVYYDPKNPKADPLQRPAVVLIDEIDAHMHPAWQQGLPLRLAEQFPKVQFIVTTHSPFVVAGIPVAQVIRLRRNKKDEVVRVENVEEDMTMGRADQILTGDLFGLETTLDPKTQKVIERYEELLGKEKRTPEEEADFENLGRELEIRIPVSGEKPVVRRAQELVRIVIEGDYPILREKTQQLARALYRDDEDKETGK